MFRSPGARLAAPAALLLTLVGVQVASMGVASTGDEPPSLMGVLRPPAPTPVPHFTFRTLEGREARLGHLRGRPVLVGFFTTW
jgi:cytochrome oxidase Cu insertion factor (SCO1/SenC/PrrC family)